MSIKGSIHSFETFGSVDGPGVRFITFLNGCSMRCKYCHNADTWKMGEATMTSDEVLNKALRYKTYWRNGGGITVSGGEPLLQIDFVLDLFKKAKAKGVHTTLDTSGNPFSRDPEFLKKFDALLEVTDLILLDLKHIDPQKHLDLTAQPNDNILDLAKYLDEKNQPVWIRHVLVPGYSDDPEDLQKLSDFIHTLNNVELVEVLPYHSLGAYKWEKLGMNYLLKDVPSPTQDSVDRAKAILRCDEYKK